MGAKLCHQLLFFFTNRRRHTNCGRDWSSDVCSSDLPDFLENLHLPAVWNALIPHIFAYPKGLNLQCVPIPFSNRDPHITWIEVRGSRHLLVHEDAPRSEERRVGIECILMYTGFVVCG